MAPSTETDRQIESTNQLIPVVRLLFSSGRVAPFSVAEFPIQSVVVSAQGVQIGRAVGPKEGIPLPGDKRASAVHARIALAADGMAVVVQDVGSKNGTFVNGELRREARLSLAQPAVLRVGNSLLLVRGLRPAVWESSRHAPQVRSQALLPGTAPEMELLRYLVLCAADQDSPVLLSGETGTGKELSARMLHACSARREQPFLPINCANISESLAESQLFGHVAGAFTGAKTAQPGWFRQAHGGTLFLDEVGELPLSLQPKFLRALEERQLWPVGSREPVPVDVRVVAATNRDLDDAVARGQFRADLLARLAVLRIGLPRLTTRSEDILPLFLRRLGRPALISARLAEALLLFPWPMNVRQLFSLAEHACAFAADVEELDLPLFAERLAAPRPDPGRTPERRGVAGRQAAGRQGHPALVAASSSTPPTGARPSDGDFDRGGASGDSLGLGRARVGAAVADATNADGAGAGQEAYSPAILQRMLREEGGNISGLARLMGVSRRTVNRLLGKAGLRSQDFRASSSTGPSMLSETPPLHEHSDAHPPGERKPGG